MTAFRDTTQTIKIIGWLSLLSWGFFSIEVFSAQPVVSEKNELLILTTFSEEPIVAIIDGFHQKYPETNVRVIHRRTASSIQYINKAYHDIDIILSSSPMMMNHLIKNNKLATLPKALLPPEYLTPYNLPDSRKVATIGYSGAGLIWNKEYMKGHDLEVPTTWEKLVSPRYFQHITMSSPSRSGTTHLMLESTLQKYGWKKGWHIMMQIGANLATISSRSFGVSDAVAKGMVGIGPTIDSYAIIWQEKLNNTQFTYLKEFTLMPTYVGVINNLPLDKSAFDFITFLQSDFVQKQLINSRFAKQPIIAPQLTLTDHIALDPKLMTTREKTINYLFDLAITKQLPELNDMQLSLITAKQEFIADNSAQEIIQQARKMAFQFPINEDEAQHVIRILHSDELTEEQKNTLDELSYVWEQRFSTNLENAEHILFSLHDE